MHSEGRTWNSAVCFSIIASYLRVLHTWGSHAPTYRLCIVQWNVLVRRRPVIRMRPLFVLRHRWCHPAMCRPQVSSGCAAVKKEMDSDVRLSDANIELEVQSSAHVVIGGIFYACADKHTRNMNSNATNSMERKLCALHWCGLPCLVMCHVLKGNQSSQYSKMEHFVLFIEKLKFWTKI